MNDNGKFRSSANQPEYKVVRWYARIRAGHCFCDFQIIHMSGLGNMITDVLIYMKEKEWQFFVAYYG